MIVYGSTLSPFVRKVMAMIAEKGLSAELVAAGMGRGGPDFEAASPFRKMPALRDGDYVLSDSTAIAVYLDAAYPQANLIPEEAKARGRTMWWDEFADTIFVACAGKMFFNRVVAPRFMKREGDLAAADAAERDELPALLAYLEGAIPDSGFLVEDRLTLADLAVASPFANLSHAGVDVDAGRYPRLAAYAAAILARPSFADQIAVEQRMMGVAA